MWGAASNRKLLFGCAMRGRNPDNPNDRKTKSNGTFRQMIEIGKFGISNTITSVQKDSLIAEVCQKKTSVRIVKDAEQCRVD